MKRTDPNTGGEASIESESPFQALSEPEDERTRLGRIFRVFDVWVMTPSKVAWNDIRTRIGLLIIGLYVFAGTIGIFLITQPTGQHDRYVKPMEALSHPLGTDIFGNDILALLVHATPAMLKMIMAGAIFSTVMAAVVGLASGYIGGLIDRVLMTVTDIAMTIPGLPLVMVIALIYEPESPYIVGIILTINAWAGLARAIRSQVLTLREETFVEASRIMGIPKYQIISQDVLPGLMPYITVNFVNSARQVIYASVALYFLGVLPFTNLNWGVMLNQAYQAGGSLYTLDTAHWLIAPMVTIILISVGLTLFAQGTDRLFNPRIRARHSKVASEEEGQP